MTSDFILTTYLFFTMCRDRATDAKDKHLLRNPNTFPKALLI